MSYIAWKDQLTNRKDEETSSVVSKCVSRLQYDKISIAFSEVLMFISANWQLEASSAQTVFQMGIDAQFDSRLWNSPSLTSSRSISYV